jgi:hypothetical protein
MLIKKMSYNFSAIEDLEDYYDEIFEIYILRFEHFERKKKVVFVEPEVFVDPVIHST